MSFRNRLALFLLVTLIAVQASTANTIMEAEFVNDRSTPPR